MDEAVLPFYVAAARLSAALRHTFPEPLAPPTWRVQVPTELFPITISSEDGGTTWRAFALRGPTQLHACLIDHVPGLRSIRETLRGCAILIRDTLTTGPAVEVFHELFNGVFLSCWLSDLTVEKVQGEEDGRRLVTFSTIAPNAHLADQMAVAARSLPCHPPKAEPSPASPLLSDLGEGAKVDHVALYQAWLEENKERGIPKPALQARKAVEAITGKKYGRDSLRVMTARRKQRERKQKGKG